MQSSLCIPWRRDVMLIQQHEEEEEKIEFTINLGIEWETLTDGWVNDYML